MEIKSKLSRGLWGSGRYCKASHEGSMDRKHPGMRDLVCLAKDAHSIIDLGCGEGTRLSIVAKGKVAWGIDINEMAISQAKKKYPKFKFSVSDLEKLPFKNGSFDLVYGAYVLEHLSNPELVLKEAIRITKKGGCLVFVAPNYGAPNRASPPFVGSRFRKLFRGLLLDIRMIFGGSGNLNWNRVVPISDIENYEMDFDTVVEPYILTLIKYLSARKLVINKSMSCWNQELAGVKFHQRIIKQLAKMGIYPFVYWGPHMVVVATKHK